MVEAWQVILSTPNYPQLGSVYVIVNSANCRQISYIGSCYRADGGVKLRLWEHKFDGNLLPGESGYTVASGLSMESMTLLLGLLLANFSELSQSPASFHPIPIRPPFSVQTSPPTVPAQQAMADHQVAFDWTTATLP
jgi:hypothetical protein